MNNMLQVPLTAAFSNVGYQLEKLGAINRERGESFFQFVNDPCSKKIRPTNFYISTPPRIPATSLPA